MDRGPGGQRGTRVVIVEDSFAAVVTLKTRLERAIGSHGQRVTSTHALDHRTALERSTRLDADVYLVDARRHPNDRVDNPSLSSFAGLEVAQRIQDHDPNARVIGYSAHAGAPEVNIPFREPPVVHAVYDDAMLVDHLAEALWADRFDHEVTPPIAEDYADLGVCVGAKPWAALRVAMGRPDMWEAVARTEPWRTMENRTRQHLNNRLRDLLPTAEPVTYRHYVDVLRRVAGFPH